MIRSPVPCRILAALLLPVFLLAGAAAGATIRVPNQHATVQAAINAAAAGDIVEITNSATYTEDVTISKTLTLRAAAGQTPRILATNTAERFGHLGMVGPDHFGTVVRAGGVVIEGITFENDDPAVDALGVSSALLILNSNCTVDGCRITSAPVAAGNGLGAAVIDLDKVVGGPTPVNTLFTDCVFDTNNYGFASSWFIDPATPPETAFINCTFTQTGSASIEIDSGNVLAQDCVMHDNPGGGVGVGGGSARLERCVIAASGELGADIDLDSRWDETTGAPIPCAPGCIPPGTLELDHCLVYSNGFVTAGIRVREGTLKADHTIFSHNDGPHIMMDDNGPAVAPARVFANHCDFYQAIESSEIAVLDANGTAPITLDIRNCIIAEGDGGYFAVENQIAEPAVLPNLVVEYNAVYSLAGNSLWNITQQQNNLLDQAGWPPYNSTDLDQADSFMLPAGSPLLTAGENGTYLGARGTGDEPAEPTTVQIGMAGAQPQLTWASAAGKSYQIQARPGLAAGDWETLATIVAAGETTSWTDGSALLTARFYRVVQVD